MGKLQKLDNRIQVMLQNGVNQNFRTILVIVGNKGQDQVPILHQIQTAVTKKGMLKILWCYKKELSFSTHRKRNLKLLNKRRKAGIVSEGTVFEQFICSTDIRWCYYHETDKILGQTFNMCILQDFEALTPNTLARTIETVSGGGVVVFLLKSMESLQQLCTMAMDVHARYRTEANSDVVCRFNERFLLSLANNPQCIVIDDRWNILPISKKVINNLGSMPDRDQLDYVSKEQTELTKLQLLLTEDGSYFAALVNLCKTLDQAKSVLQFCSALLDVTNPFSKTDKSSKSSSLSSTFDLSTQNLIASLSKSSEERKKSKASSAVVVMTAGRGRGKSAAMGLGLAAAFDAGLPNMCVTAPSPENLLTLMQFVLLGLRALKYEEHVDYIVFRSTDADHNKAIVRVEVTRRSYRQCLIYQAPCEASTIGKSWQPDLFCIDEAAAIPLPSVKQMINGPKLVFMASTINGYEGTGRSLSLKLIIQLRSECQRVDAIASSNTKAIGKSLNPVNKSRLLYEISLKEAIRYANGDPVENWLSDLLCLDCGEKLVTPGGGVDAGIAPAPDLCQLYYVNRDTLFAYHASTEVFLQRLMALYVASHYKNSPNDLQLLSDAPAHHIFCLLAPYDPSSGRVPEILCVLQVCLEGRINRESVLRGLARGLKPSGDLIPWTISQQFCEPNFGELSGARVIRIATHPNYQGLGYGSRALKLLHNYYLCKIPQSAPLSAKEAPNLPQNSKMKLKKSVKEDEISSEDDQEDEDEEEIPEHLSDEEEDDKKKKLKEEKSKLLTEKVERRESSSLPPLLNRLSERPPEKLNYIGVSFGATPKLIRFWKKAGYLPVYLRQTMNDLTGEFSCIMLSELRHDGETAHDFDWLKEFYSDFCKRFIKLLSGPFRHLAATYSLELLSAKATRSWSTEEISGKDLLRHFSELELERLHRYLRSLLDFPMIADQLPDLATLFFLRRFPTVKLNKTQQVILVGLGLQRKSAVELGAELESLLGADGSSIAQAKGDGDKDSLWAASKVEPKKESEIASSGWARRIRGLLFVAVRELVRSMDEAIKADGGDPNPQLKSLLQRGALNAALPDVSSNQSPNDVNMRGEHKSSDEEEDAELGDEFVLGDVADQVNPNRSNMASGDTAVDGEEQKRRAALVKQMLQEESETNLAKFLVKGSEKNWNNAVAGHGSELASLKIRLPADEQQSSSKRKREAVGDRNDRRKMRRNGQEEESQPKRSMQHQKKKFHK